MTAPHRRAGDSQRLEVGKELHSAVDRVVAAWPILERQAEDMGRGFPSQGEGPGGVGSHGDPVARLALEERLDPALLASSWVAEFEAWRLEGRRLASRSTRLLPVVEAGPAPAAVERRPSCESCGEESEVPKLKMGRWCDGCYRRLLRHRVS